MNEEEIRECALSFPGVTEDQPFGDDNITFRIGGKIFLCLSLSCEGHNMQPQEPHFAMKLTPERNEELREEYPGIPRMALEQETLERHTLYTTQP